MTNQSNHHLPTSKPQSSGLDSVDVLDSGIHIEQLAQYIQRSASMNAAPEQDSAQQANTAHEDSSAAMLTQQKNQIPPLEQWQPNFSGNMDLTIKANGEWWHEGRLITRQRLINLFAKVLWAEVDDKQQVQYFLKTPVEKWRIQVEDAPLLVTQVAVIEQKKGETYQKVLQFLTNQGDVVIADEQHPIRFGLPFIPLIEDDENKQKLISKQAEQPYLLVRNNGDSALYGLIHRNVFYHLITYGQLIEQGSSTSLILVSGNAKFVLTMG